MEQKYTRAIITSRYNNTKDLSIKCRFCIYFFSYLYYEKTVTLLLITHSLFRMELCNVHSRWFSK